MRVLYMFIVSLLLSPIPWAEANGSVFFIDGSTHQYLRTRSSSDVSEAIPLSATEVGAAVSVLLGHVPPATLSADGSFKLNKILRPNPFERPRTVFMLEVAGFDESLLKSYPNHAFLSNAIRSVVIPGSDQAEIQLPDEGEVSVVSLDESFPGLTDKDISDFASWFGGSYIVDPMEPLAGSLSIPLGNEANANFHLSKRAEMEFVLSLLALTHNSRTAVDLHEDLVQSTGRPAELMSGCFNGIKALQEEYGAEGLAKQGMEILLATLTKLFGSLKASHKGQIVGVVVFKGKIHSESHKMLNFVYTSRSSPRWLAEKGETSNSTLVAEVVLVRRTLAWLTGIILLIATLLGVYFLLNMPVTRDTLLYSNVKLD